MLVDGELSSHDEQALMAFLAKNPELENELAAFNMVKLQPDTDIVFENKEKLMKSVSTKRVIAFPTWQRYCIAAGVAAIIFITLFKFRPEENKVASVAPAPVKTTAPAVVPAQKTNAPVKEEQVPVSAQQIAKVESVKPTENKVVVAKKKVEAANLEIMCGSAVAFEKVNTAEPAGLRSIDNAPSAATTLSSAPAVTLVGEVEVPQHRSLFDKLGIEEGKKEGIEALTSAVTNTLDKVHSIKKEIDDRSLSVKIENKRLILSF